MKIENGKKQKFDYNLTSNMKKRIKTRKRAEFMKNAVVILFFVLMFNLVAFWAIKLYDSAYEQRASASGYELPINQVRK